jgi:hypothetical protein
VRDWRGEHAVQYDELLPVHERIPSAEHLDMLTRRGCLSTVEAQDTAEARNQIKSLPAGGRPGPPRQ